MVDAPSTAWSMFRRQGSISIRAWFADGSECGGERSESYETLIHVHAVIFFVLLQICVCRWLVSCAVGSEKTVSEFFTLEDSIFLLQQYRLLNLGETVGDCLDLGLLMFDGRRVSLFGDRVSYDGYQTILDKMRARSESRLVDSKVCVCTVVFSRELFSGQGTVAFFVYAKRIVDCTT